METLGGDSSNEPGKNYNFLSDSETKKQIPLYHVETEVTIDNNIAQIDYIQFYYNICSRTIETKYSFPIHPSAVLSRIELRYEDTVIVTRVEEWKQAKCSYEDAVASGKTAVISQPFICSDNIRSIALGNIPPKCEIILVCTFYQLLTAEDLSWCLFIPSKIVPIYMGNELKFIKTGKHLKSIHENKTKHSSKSSSKMSKFCKFFWKCTKTKDAKDAEEAEERKEELDRTRSACYQETNFTWQMKVTINSSSKLTRVVSFTHAIDVEFTNKQWTQAIVSFDSSSGIKIKDFKILFRNDEINKPMVIAQEQGDEYALAISFLADLTPNEKLQKRNEELDGQVDLDGLTRYSEEGEDENMPPQEFYFVLDRSGSMTGKPINVAKDAIILFIRSIPTGSKFNIYSFGSDFQKIFYSAVEYNQSTLEQAISEIKGYEADLGGTEISQPLESIFEGVSSDSDKLDKHIYLLTDGCVFNPQEVIDLITKNNQTFTTHTFGIGEAVSTQLIEECATAGRGKYYYVDNDATGLKGKVINALRKAFEPKFLTKQNTIALKSQLIFSYPKFDKDGIIYNGNYLTHFLIIKKEKSNKINGKITMKLVNSKTKKISTVSINLSKTCRLIGGDSIFKLTVIEAIADMIKHKKSEVAVSMSKKYQTPCKLTALFAAERLLSNNNEFTYKQSIVKKNSGKITIFIKGYG